MRILTLDEQGLVAGGRMAQPELMPPAGGGGGGGYYNGGYFGGEMSDFFYYGGTECSDFSEYGGSSALNSGFTDYMASNVDTDASLTTLGSVVGGAINTVIAQYGALAATGEAVATDVAAAAAGVGALYGGAVTIAAAGGWQIGSWIYNKYQVHIDDAVDATVNFVRRHL